MICQTIIQIILAHYICFFLFRDVKSFQCGVENKFDEYVLLSNLNDLMNSSPLRILSSDVSIVRRLVLRLISTHTLTRRKTEYFFFHSCWIQLYWDQQRWGKCIRWIFIDFFPVVMLSFLCFLFFFFIFQMFWMFLFNYIKFLVVIFSWFNRDFITRDIFPT